ncbi:3-keto-disaccharide hydrolase [Mangrovibacterium diazotrophicum]|uniref:Uncharacterized protein DUF1080 n=1 Tax=Mangrovibacterium diazotrophicum TaxID=1261403 RepID=A0A419WBG8_9BACT|nr:DUF1080 domain-containing protein [Mangrovibacterium diazotrophicum]RKD92803.1 uncharacterized protein DUF1080 [Mangrovibacterium diazotrophicum]
MKRFPFRAQLSAMLFLVFSSFSLSSFGQTINLLDKDLSQWEMYQSYRYPNNYNGSQPVDESGELLPSIGYNKNVANVFSVNIENGDPVLRISGEIYGCLFTKNEFENYHLTLKVKWGVQKFEPRLDKLKDSGLLYHSQGECGVDYWRSWMLSQEFQIMEGHMGDYWGIANSAIDVRAFLPEGMMNTVADVSQEFLPIGPGSGRDGFCLRSANYESAPGDWTTIELICFGDKSIHLVNGHVVMVLQNSRLVKDGESSPLTKGKIQLQSEAAEVFFKNIQLESISEIPATYSVYFK